MNLALANLKLRTYVRGFGEMTYAEICKLATESEDILKHLPVSDMAFAHMAQLVRSYWKYAEAFAQVNGLSDIDHCIQKKYLCAWKATTRFGARKSINRTEEVTFNIPRYNRSLSEERYAILDILNTLFENEAYDSNLELMEI